MKVVLGGPPRTGKSCLRENLKQSIRRLAPSGPYPYVLTANPDGEGSWFQATVAGFPDEAAQQKAANKRKFDERHAARFAEEVKRCQEPLVFVDIGGLISLENHRICQHASHIVILYRTETDLAEWRAFAAELKLTVLAELKSSHDVTQDTVGPPATPVLTGTVHGLKRGDLTTPHPAVDALAQRLLDTINDHPTS